MHLQKLVKKVILENPFLIPWALDFKRTFEGVGDTADNCNKLIEPGKRSVYSSIQSNCLSIVPKPYCFCSERRKEIQIIIFTILSFDHCSICLEQLKKKADVEYNRLVNKLPKGKQNKFHEGIAICFKNDGN